MLSRAQKTQHNIAMLTKRADFVAMQTAGRKWVSPAIILQIRDNDLGTIRLGFTVSKRTSKLAVERNRIKRRLRAVAAKTMPGLAKISRDYVLIGRPEALTKPFDALCRDLTWCLKRLESLDAPPAD